MFRRDAFGDLLRTQLDLFERDHDALIRKAQDAEHAYDRAPRDEAEERYGEYLDLVETGTELLAELRDAYAASLDDDTAEAYAAAFNHAVSRRFPRFALEIGDT